MSDEWKRRAIEAALQQQFGPDAASQASMDEYNEKQTDWFGWCSKCGKELKGTRASLRGHKCDTEA